MLNKFKSIFTLQSPEPGLEIGAEERLQLSQAALMYHIIAADGEITADEKQRLETILREQFDLETNEIKALIEKAEKAENTAIDLYSFTRHLNRVLSEDERLALIENLWKLAYADKNIHEFEDNIVWRVSELLHVETRQRMKMKQSARQAHEDG